jgi:hypothetical protein
VLESLEFAGECLGRSWAFADADVILIGIGWIPSIFITLNTAVSPYLPKQSKTTIQQAVGLPITEDHDIFEPSVCNYP